MSRLRAIIIACLTLAVAALPAAGASASMLMSDAAHGMAQADCAKNAGAAQSEYGQADHQAKADQAKGHCADHVACGTCMCLGLTAVLTETAGTQPARLPRPATARVAVNFSGPAYIPPSPPPRV